MPKLSFPGGALIGCSAGFVNVPRIKGSHNAMLSGMLAAEHVAAALAGRPRQRRARRLRGRPGATADIGKDLKRVRNVKPLWSSFGTAARRRARRPRHVDRTQLFGFSLFGTLKHGKPDHATLEAGRRRYKPIAYPKPDGVLTFDRLSSVFLSNTNHEEDQPVHLKLTDPSIPVSKNLPTSMASPSQRYCPAGVYEVVDADDGDEGRPALRDQRAELRPLQDLRHQGPDPEHQLGDAGGRRRAELPEHVDRADQAAAK